MDSAEISSQDKLDQLLEDGKISSEEYKRLCGSLEVRREQVAASAPLAIPRGVPWQIWVVVVLLGLEGIDNLLAIPRIPVAAYWLAAKCVLILGLLKGWKWVFVVSLVLAVIHALYFALAAPVVSLLNLALLVLQVSAWRFYFPKRDALSCGKQ